MFNPIDIGMWFAVPESRPTPLGNFSEGDRLQLWQKNIEYILLSRSSYAFSLLIKCQPTYKLRTLFLTFILGINEGTVPGADV